MKTYLKKERNKMACKKTKAGACMDIQNKLPCSKKFQGKMKKTEKRKYVNPMDKLYVRDYTRKIM